MKLSASILLPALCWAVQLVSASSGSVFVNDGPNTEKWTPGSLSPVPARLVLAQRAGVEDYHSADLSQEGVVEAINDYGRRTSLFEQDKRGRAFVLVEGTWNGKDGISELSGSRHFDITDPPGANANRGLWLDLARQTQQPRYSSLDDEELTGILLSDAKPNIKKSEDRVYFHISTTASDFEETLEWIKDYNMAMTIYITPPGQYSRTGDGMYQWGTYTMPNAQSPLKKRSAQRPQQEKPLELQPTVSSGESGFLPVESSTSDYTSLADSSPLPGILPQCFTSQSECESMTRNCTGHGKCYLKYTDRSAADGSRSAQCYTCQCSASKQTTSDGKTKTTYWGGPGCQKKDVSVEFWMIALFSVGMVFLIGFAVGSVWTMGDEELPSVIGAGVSGAVKRS